MQPGPRPWPCWARAAPSRGEGIIREIYLDNSATTRPRPEVVQAVLEVLETDYGNPSSLHRKGLAAEKRLKAARAAAAEALGVDPRDILFTSGGTESNNLAIRGTARARRRRGTHLVTTRVEHASVLRTMEDLEEEGCGVTYLDVDETGRVDPGAVEAALRPDTILVSIMAVNNEVGAVQPVEEIGALLRGRKDRPYFHVDAVQALGKLAVQPLQWGADLVTLSGHKIHGLKGSGVLYRARGTQLRPVTVGGEQEAGMRGGTENVPGIVAFGVAARLAEAERSAAVPRLEAGRRRLYEAIRSALPEVILNGSLEVGAPHILNLSFPGVRGEVLVHALEQRGVYVSTSSACSSRNQEPSHVLEAMGLTGGVLAGAVRFSLSPATTLDELDEAARLTIEAVTELARFQAR